MSSSWLPIAPDSGFGLHNLPFCIFSPVKSDARIRFAGVRVGDYLFDLARLEALGYFADVYSIDNQTFTAGSLNPLMAHGAATRRAVRRILQNFLSNDLPEKSRFGQPFPGENALWFHVDRCALHLPIQVADYTDFYSSEQHATNVGMMFRDPANALLPNWKHLPVAYHGRAGSIVVSGTPFHRPKGQTRPNDAEPPKFGPTQQLDFELEMAHVIGTPTALGESLSVDEALNHVWGFLVFNDWSARDIQRWEYVPLGPFLAKNFCSSVSPYVVTPEALEAFQVAPGVQSPEVLPYLQGTRHWNYDVQLEVAIQPADGPETVVSRSNYRHLYWTVAQQVAHHTVNGCPLRTGDLMASGTISGPTPDSFGSMLELAWAGKQPLTLADGSTRKFILDGDTVVMRAFAEKDGLRVDFGEVRTTVLPAV